MSFLRNIWGWFTTIRFGLLLIFSGIIIGVIGFTNHIFLLRLGPNGSIIGEMIEQYYANVSSEALFLGLTVLIVNRLFNREEQREEQRKELNKLITQMGSKVPDVALSSVEHLWNLGAIENGSLVGKHFYHSSLRGVDLHHADIREARFSYANLRDANFRFANLSRAQLDSSDLRNASFQLAILQGATISMGRLDSTDFVNADLRDIKLILVDLTLTINISDIQLVLADSLLGSTMPSGRKYDGRFRFSGDINYANASGVDIGNAVEMANFYSVSLDNYQEGQLWADNDLNSLLQEANIRADIVEKMRDKLSYGKIWYPPEASKE